MAGSAGGAGCHDGRGPGLLCGAGGVPGSCHSACKAEQVVQGVLLSPACYLSWRYASVLLSEKSDLCLEMSLRSNMPNEEIV